MPPFYVPSRVAEAVELVLGARRPRTVAVPRTWGVVRLAQVPPVGAVLDVVLGALGPRLAGFGREQVRRRQHGSPVARPAARTVELAPLRFEPARATPPAP